MEITEILTKDGQSYYREYQSLSIEYRLEHSFEDYISELIKCYCCEEWFEFDDIEMNNQGEYICEQCKINGYGE